MLTGFNQTERNSLIELRKAVKRGDYDSDRRPTYDGWDAVWYVVGHAMLLMGVSLLVGMLLGSVMLAFLLARGW